MPGFTEGEGAEEFIEAFKGAVVPRDRKAKARDLLPPVLLLAGGEQARARAMRGLRRILHPDGAKRVPCAALGPDEIRAAAGRRRAARPLLRAADRTGADAAGVMDARGRSSTTSRTTPHARAEG